MHASTGTGREVLVSQAAGLNDDAVVEERIGSWTSSSWLSFVSRRPPAAVAVAIGTYLEGSLGALLDEGLCTADEVRGLLREIEAGVFQPHDPSEK